MAQNKTKKLPPTSELISLSKAAKFSPYTAEYLGLRARQGKLKATKLNGVWLTKSEWLDEYLVKVQTKTQKNQQAVLKKTAAQKDLIDETFVSLNEAARSSPYSAEYLSLRARQGKLKATKLNGVWLTKSEWLDEYLRQNKKLPVERQLTQPPPQIRQLNEQLISEINFQSSLSAYSHVLITSALLAKDNIKISKFPFLLKKIIYRPIESARTVYGFLKQIIKLPFEILTFSGQALETLIANIQQKLRRELTISFLKLKWLINHLDAAPTKLFLKTSLAVLLLTLSGAWLLSNLATTAKIGGAVKNNSLFVVKTTSRLSVSLTKSFCQTGLAIKNYNLNRDISQSRTIIAEKIDQILNINSNAFYNFKKQSTADFNQLTKQIITKSAATGKLFIKTIINTPNNISFWPEKIKGIYAVTDQKNENAKQLTKQNIIKNYKSVVLILNSIELRQIKNIPSLAFDSYSWLKNKIELGTAIGLETTAQNLSVFKNKLTNGKLYTAVFLLQSGTDLQSIAINFREITKKSTASISDALKTLCSNIFSNKHLTDSQMLFIKKVLSSAEDIIKKLETEKIAKHITVLQPSDLQSDIIIISLCQQVAQPATIDGKEMLPSFRVCLAEPNQEIIRFNWWIIETTADNTNYSSSEATGGNGVEKFSTSSNNNSSPAPSPSDTASPSPASPSTTPTETATPSESPLPTPEVSVTPWPSIEPTPEPTPEPIVLETPTP